MLSDEFFPPRWVGGNVPRAADYSASALPSLTRDTQSPHRAHDRDLVPGIAASRRLDAAISQRLRNLAEGLGRGL